MIRLPFGLTTEFLKDAGERAGKSLFGGWASYLVETFISNHQWPLVHALEFGGATAFASIVMSLISRHLGTKGTASLLKRVSYRKHGSGPISS